MLKLIEAVRQHPSLWNPHHPDYRDFVLKDEAWKIIVENVNIKNIKDVQSAKVEWKKLRDNHRDALKRAKLGKNKLLPAQITTWKYAKAMQFLEPHMKYRITEHIENDPLTAQFPSTEHDVSTTEMTPIIVQPPDKLLKRRRTEQSSKGDALDAFFNCMCQSTREMPPWMQTQVKKKIFDVIIEAEEVLNTNRDEAEGLVDQQWHDYEAVDDDDAVKVEIKPEVITDECDE